ncbi:MAG: fumarylacetoacetate hydrolase family protein [Pigmentiphaga sp.]|nr:fumarylacetoacetate hydrolase family protein [Pigmentiphaga sp.]
MKPYALTTFSAEGLPAAPGLVIDGRVAAIAELCGSADEYAGLRGRDTVLAILDAWELCLPLLERLAQGASGDAGWRPLETVRVHAPVERPRQVFCTGANYRKHVVDLTVDSGVGPEGLQGAELRRWAEQMMDERAAHGEPYVFTKPVSAIAGPYDDLILPRNTAQPDWELELAVVIGRGGRTIPRARALEHVAGYMIANDISARDLIPRTDYKMLGTDWLRAKGQPGFLPLGPWLVPARFVADPHRLRMRLTVSGRVMQDETTADMIFGIERQIEYISQYCELLPGDVICTGSPAGNGTHYNRFLQDGDVMEAEIEGLGRQSVVCRADRDC